MISLRNKYRLKVSNRLAATAALLLVMSSAAAPVSLIPTDQNAERTAEAAAEREQPQDSSALEGAVAEIASVVGQSGKSSLNISSLIFRF